MKKYLSQVLHVIKISIPTTQSKTKYCHPFTVAFVLYVNILKWNYTRKSCGSAMKAAIMAQTYRR